MTVEELKTRPEYVTLGPRQQQFVLAYCTNGADKLAAAHTAHKLKNDASATATADRHLRHPAIRALVNLFYERTEDIGSKKEALALIWQEARKSGPDKFKWMQLFCELMGFKGRPEPNEPETDYAAAVAALKET